MRTSASLAATVTAILFIGGCKSDLSAYPPFDTLVGHPQRLERAAWLHGEKPPYQLADHKATDDATQVEQGTEVVIDKVVRQGLFGLYMYSASGHTTGGAEPIRFSYHWGHNGLIYEAPWEDFADGDGVRWVGPKGTQHGEPMPVYTDIIEPQP